ncbi:HlyD family secretion protein [Arenibaculum pallidiluteum]|uniref:HlyD family secretion protein n=1 Tax=Arenibaculum pallidiluteum TaxID=2812559 RepID=UPI001A975C52|nr:HlyD family secretion protein [Arenibaculum pallidiluteum]
MRKILLPLMALGILGGGGYAGWGWWTTGRFLESTDNAQIESDITVLTPKVSGTVLELLVGDNQPVAAGEVLLRLDDADYRARLDEATAAVEAARAALLTIESRVALERSLIAQRDADIPAAEADLRRARQDWERARSLISTDNVTRQRFDLAEADLRKAEAALQRARAAAAAERDQLGVVEAGRAEAIARIRETEARADLARRELEDTVIRAPVAGVVGNRAVQLGQQVRPGAQLMAVVPLPQVHVVANFKETQVARMRPGQRVEVLVDAFPGVPVPGVVESFAPASGSQFSLLPPENATGNFTKIVQRLPVRIRLDTDNPLAGSLRPGLSVEVSVDIRGRGDGTAGAAKVAAAAPAEGAGVR